MMFRPLTIISLLFFSMQAHATTYEEMNQQIAAFEKSGQARFAPATLKRVKAFQGASMLAAEEQGGFNSEGSNNLDKAINKTLQALGNAKNNALSFRNTYPDLIQLETEATKALVYHHKPQVLPEETVQNLYNDAQKQMNIAIVNTEKGGLNLARQATQKAAVFFDKTIDAAMPSLVKKTDRALSQASSVGANKYAPRTYEKAEQLFEQLEAYSEDLERKPENKEYVKRPERIGLALETAVYAQKIAIRVKDWRRDKGSYEKLTLTSKENRLKLAKAMNIPLGYEKVDIDISAEDLLKYVQQMQQTLDDERKQHAMEIASLNENFETNLQTRLREQRLKDQTAFQSKVANIKSAFNSKLERETFEKKRQQKIRNLFTKNEAEIITNLDGSLLIRAKKLQFGSSSSKVDGKYFDFLGRIKEALDLYPVRTIIIEGHTDSSGDAKTNRQLSLDRAESVLEFLVATGLDADRIKALGYGEVKPIATNMYKKGRAMNRRIDILIQAPS